MRSLFSSVSGLRAHQTKMDGIGNNIANVNTVGYKSTVTNFSEIFSQTMQGASSPQQGRGGTNPMQVGLGISVQEMSVKHTQGSSQSTGAPTDLMLQGEGFFVVTDDPTYKNKYFTRAGNFKIDAKGNLVTPDGMKVLSKDSTPVVIDKSTTVVGEATTGVKVRQNLNFNEEVDEDTGVAYQTAVKVYDSLGKAHDLKIKFGEKLIYKTDADPAENGSLRAIQLELGGKTIGSLSSVLSAAGIDDNKANDANDLHAYVKFDEYGRYAGFVTIAGVENKNPAMPVVNQVNYIQDNDAAFAKLSIEPEGADKLEISLVTENGGGTTLNPNKSIFSNMTHYSMQSDIIAKENDGKPAGKLQEFNIAPSGEIVATYTNGDRTVLSQIMLAAFDNPQGLQKIGSNKFVDTPNSGNPKFGTAGASGIGTIMAGAIEMSNVDLSQEFTEMITTQRGFQANARVITTSDEMLQELTNLKR